MKEKIGFIGLGLIEDRSQRQSGNTIRTLNWSHLISKKKHWHSLPRKASSTPHVLRSTTAFATAHICFYVLLSPITMPIWHN